VQGPPGDEAGRRSWIHGHQKFHQIDLSRNSHLRIQLSFK
jgi:hypothetical protein